MFYFIPSSKNVYLSGYMFIVFRFEKKIKDCDIYEKYEIKGFFGGETKKCVKNLWKVESVFRDFLRKKMFWKFVYVFSDFLRKKV